jgi:hypothetical protein
MARSQKKVRVTTTKSGPGRATRTQSRRSTTTTSEVEVVQEKRGMSYEDGVAIAVTLVLLAAILLLDYVRGTGYGEGMFFK